MGTNLKVGIKVGDDGSDAARSCLQNSVTIDMADAMSAWELPHPVAAIEEAAEIAAENRLHAHIQSPQPT